MMLSPHFSLEEFTTSETAVRRAIDNTLPPHLFAAAMETCKMMERIRLELERLAGREIPITVTSGYRSPALNLAIGSGPGSDHPKAAAMDFKAPVFGTPYDVARALAPLVSQLGIGQLIHEFGSWVHVSTRRSSKDINRIITISSAGTVAGVQRV